MTTYKRQVVLASHNAGKVVELGRVLAPLGWQLSSLAKHDLPAPDETGTTYAANATLKAMAAADSTGLWALADDSGLEVDALQGGPGVDTAHFGGWPRLLEALANVDAAQRGARFRCVLALVGPEPAPLLFTGVCEGRIALQAAGDGGFGYDPVFIPAGYTCTFAEMTTDAKAAISHRGLALQALFDWATQRQAD